MAPLIPCLLVYLIGHQILFVLIILFVYKNLSQDEIEEHINDPLSACGPILYIWPLLVPAALLGLIIYVIRSTLEYEKKGDDDLTHFVDIL
jgi:hypothetical protein